MKRVLLILSLFVFVQYLMAQDIYIPESDSVNVGFDKAEMQFMYDQLFDFSEHSLYGGLLDFSSPLFTEPIIPESQWKIGYDFFSSFQKEGKPFQYLGIGFNPFISNLNILNQASYQLNDKFSVGGNSFIGNSIFAPSFNSKSFENPSIRGASMFMEYKPSKKVSFRATFSVENHQQLPVP